MAPETPQPHRSPFVHVVVAGTLVAALSAETPHVVQFSYSPLVRVWPREALAPEHTHQEHRARVALELSRALTVATSTGILLTAPPDDVLRLRYRPM